MDIENESFRKNGGKCHNILNVLRKGLNIPCIQLVQCQDVEMPQETGGPPSLTPGPSVQVRDTAKPIPGKWAEPAK
jgi:hypothetical protein